MRTATRAERWKIQNSKMRSRNTATNRCTRNMTADMASMTVAAIRHDSGSGGTSSKVSQKIVEAPT